MVSLEMLSIWQPAAQDYLCTAPSMMRQEKCSPEDLGPWEKE